MLDKVNILSPYVYLALHVVGNISLQVWEKGLGNLLVILGKLSGICWLLWESYHGICCNYLGNLSWYLL